MPVQPPTVVTANGAQGAVITSAPATLLMARPAACEGLPVHHTTTTIRPTQRAGALGRAQSAFRCDKLQHAHRCCKASMWSLACGRQEDATWLPTSMQHEQPRLQMMPEMLSIFTIPTVLLCGACRYAARIIRAVPKWVARRSRPILSRVSARINVHRTRIAANLPTWASGSGSGHAPVNRLQVRNFALLSLSVSLACICCHEAACSATKSVPKA